LIKLKHTAEIEASLTQLNTHYFHQYAHSKNSLHYSSFYFN